MKQIEEFRINSHETDINDAVRPSAVLRYMQETANLEHYRHGPTTAELRERGMAFIVSRLTMNIYRPLHVFEDITVESWLCKTHAMSFIRCGRILRGGEVIAELTSQWAMVDTVNHKLLRTADVELGFGYDEPLEMDAMPRNLLPHDIELVLAGEHAVGYGDVDINRHMNNTNYFDMLCGYIPSMDNKTVISASITFNSEAPLGETLKVYRGADCSDDVYSFRTLRQSGAVNVEAVITLDEIN